MWLTWTWVLAIVVMFVLGIALGAASVWRR